MNIQRNWQKRICLSDNDRYQSVFEIADTSNSANNHREKIKVSLGREI